MILEVGFEVLVTMCTVFEYVLSYAGLGVVVFFIWVCGLGDSLGGR